MIGVGDKGSYIIYYEASCRLFHDETLFFLCFFPVNLVMFAAYWVHVEWDENGWLNVQVIGMQW